MCRRTCPSGGWRAGPTWRHWVTHLSWTTSREQHLLANTSSACLLLCDADMCAWPKSHDQAKDCRDNQQGVETFASNQSKINVYVSFSLSTWDEYRFFQFLFLNHSTALKTDLRFVLKIQGIGYVRFSIQTYNSFLVGIICIDCTVCIDYDLQNWSIHKCILCCKLYPTMQCGWLDFPISFLIYGLDCGINPRK